MIRALATVALLGSLVPAVAQAQAKPDVVHFRARGEGVAPGGTVALLPKRDDNAVIRNPLYRTALEAAERALAPRGLRVSPNGKLTLNIGIRRAVAGGELFVVDPTPQDSPGPPPSPAVTDQLRVPLQEFPPGVEAGLTVTLILYGENRQPLWSAAASVPDQGDDPAMLVRRLTAASIARMGTSESGTYRLSCDGPRPERALPCFD